jgi:hypothetical protein
MRVLGGGLPAAGLEFMDQFHALDMAIPTRAINIKSIAWPR